MTSRDFVYWLQGCFEIADLKTLNEEQTQMIKNHLNMVFVHEIDPSMGDEKHQEDLQKLHDLLKPKEEGSAPKPPRIPFDGRYRC